MRPFDPTYYATMAQVLPVLFLALAIEYRYFGVVENEPAFYSFFQLGIVATLVIGELDCLFALSKGNAPSRLGETTIIVGLVMGLIAFCLPLVRPRISALARHFSRGQRLALNRSFTVAFIAMVGLAFWNVIDLEKAFSALALGILLLGCGMAAFRNLPTKAGRDGEDA